MALFGLFAGTRQRRPRTCRVLSEGSSAEPALGRGRSPALERLLCELGELSARTRRRWEAPGVCGRGDRASAWWRLPRWLAAGRARVDAGAAGVRRDLGGRSSGMLGRRRFVAGGWRCVCGVGEDWVLGRWGWIGDRRPRPVFGLALGRGQLWDRAAAPRHECRVGQLRRLGVIGGRGEGIVSACRRGEVIVPVGCGVRRRSGARRGRVAVGRWVWGLATGQPEPGGQVGDVGRSRGGLLDWAEPGW